MNSKSRNILRKVSTLLVLLAFAVAFLQPLTATSVEAAVAPYDELLTEHAKIARKAGAEGSVLLKNDNKTLPLAAGANVCLMGSSIGDYVVGGGGSGDTTTPYNIDIVQGFAAKEAEGKVTVVDAITNDYGLIFRNKAGKAAETADTAIIAFGRYSFETNDRKPEKGDYYLSDKELDMIKFATENFENVILILNIGSIVDMNWMFTEPFGNKVDSVLVTWQGGQEGGNVIADLILGDSFPSGKMPDTLVKSYSDYPSESTFDTGPFIKDQPYREDIFVGYRYFETFKPDRVLYSFGYGLSYTDFEITDTKVYEDGNYIVTEATVKNVGDHLGKEVVQTYYSAPQGFLGKPAYELGGFQKTRLLAPGEREKVTFKFDKYLMASYDDMGHVQEAAYVLEAGEYKFSVGSSLADAKSRGAAGFMNMAETQIVDQLDHRCAPTRLDKRLVARLDANGDVVPFWEFLNGDPLEPLDGNVNLDAINAEPVETVSPLEEDLLNVIEENNIDIAGKTGEEIFDALQLEVPQEEVIYVEDGDDVEVMDVEPMNADLMFNDVVENPALIPDFVAGLTNRQLADLCTGQYDWANQPANVGGIGNQPKKGIPHTACADGPAGLRLNDGNKATGWPCGTCMAATFNPYMVEQVASAVGREAIQRGVHIWLAPGMNIHRDPLGGRNFEYYSEDPVLTGRIAAGATRGVQKHNVSITLKHFAANNKDYGRRYTDSMVSERALREIYLKGFEIAVKEADPWAIMSSYNSINDTYTAGNEDLLNGILRGEWGYNGVVMTDWVMMSISQLECVMAGNDLKMPNFLNGATGLKNAMGRDPEVRRKSEIAGVNIINFILKTHVIASNKVEPYVITTENIPENVIVEHPYAAVPGETVHFTVTLLEPNKDVDYIEVVPSDGNVRHLGYRHYEFRMQEADTVIRLSVAEVDKTALRKALDDAKAILDDVREYVSYKDLIKYMEEGQIVYDDESVYQDEVDEATAKLRAAIDAMKLRQGWAVDKDGDHCYYVDGLKVTGLKKIKKTTYLFDAQGKKQYGWHVLGGKEFYFDPRTGGMLTGKRTIDGTTYLLHRTDGKLSGWHRLGGKDYYFDPNYGKGMVTGKRTIGNTTYYFHNKGYKEYGWKVFKGFKYYFDPDFGGGMVTGLRKVGQSTYFFRVKSSPDLDNRGAALTSASIWLNGVKYTFDHEGRLIKTKP